MTSPATLEAFSPNGVARYDFILAEEAMLKRKVAILEEFLKNDGQETTSLEDRCRILRRRIDLLEDEISVAGKSQGALQYLRNAPRSHFESITRDQFLEWLDGGIDTSRNSRVRSPKRSSVHIDSGFHIFSISDASESASQRVTIAQREPSPSKRQRTESNEKPACLRCRILKKRCDAFELCSHCPIQSFDNDADYWKVLGCFREHLRDFSAIFCPEYVRSSQRTIKYRDGGTDTINFVLTKSRVSEQKKRRMLHFLHAKDDFAQLKASSWEDSRDRQSISREALSLTEYDGDEHSISFDNIDLEDYEATWSVLQAVSMDPTYLKKTAYNLFSLIRLGNWFSRQEPVVWELFKQAKRLLRQSVELYLLERLCGQIASGYMASPPFDHLRSTRNTLVLVDVKEEFESFLQKFEKICLGRAKLTGHAQISCFYALLVLCVTKSMLIDAYSIRAEYESPNPWSDHDGMRITSAWKAMVSVFCRSSRYDVVMQETSGPESDEWCQMLEETRSMVQVDLWLERGIKSSKEFLLGLGSCWYPDESYNGFLVQRFGLETVAKAIIKPIDTSQRDLSARSASRSENDSMVHTFHITPWTRSDSHSRQSSTAEEEALTWISQNKTQLEGLKQIAHPTAPVSSFVFVGQNDDDDRSSSGRSRRKGALNAATLENAREVRKIGACWNCWAMKVTCSEGVTCDRCQTKRDSGSRDLCHRGPFHMLFSRSFFPDFLLAQFTREAIQDYIETNTDGHDNRTLNIEVSFGEDIKKTICVNVFRPSMNSAAETGYQALDGHAIDVESLPIGLHGEYDKIFENEYLEQLESSLSTRTFTACASRFHSSPLSAVLINAVFQYYRSMQVKHPLIRQCLLLWSAVLDARYPLMVEESSASAILKKIGRNHTESRLYSSRLLNRQFKSMIFNICRRLTVEVLTDLEKVIRKRQRELWPVCFATILILCFVMEQIQNLVHAHVQYVGLSQLSSSDGLENEPQKSCRALDEAVYGQLTYIFHALYRTSKGQKVGLNPLRDEFKGNNEPGFDDAVMSMIREIKEKCMNEELLQEQNQTPKFAMRELARRNSGRLASRFLLDFL